jgi:hypothetical protein
LDEERKYSRRIDTRRASGKKRDRVNLKRPFAGLVGEATLKRMRLDSDRIQRYSRREEDLDGLLRKVRSLKALAQGVYAQLGVVEQLLLLEADCEEMERQ